MQERQRISAGCCFCWQEEQVASGRENAKALATEPGHGTTGVVLTTVLILCHDEPGHMVGRREQSISVKRRAAAFWIENRTRKATRRNLLFLEECAVGPRGGYLLNGTSDWFWRELCQFRVFVVKRV